MRRPLFFAALAVQITALAACESGPAAPGRPLAVSIATVSAHIVTSPTATEPPFAWAVATAPITISNRGAQSTAVVTVETQAFNRTRGALISSNVRPNVDAWYLNTMVPAGGTLDLEASVVYHPLPPPGDQIRFVVIVTFDDGRTVRAEVPLNLPTA